MSIFSFNTDEPVVVPVDVEEATTEAAENQYDGLTDEDYTKAEEPDFGEDA